MSKLLVIAGSGIKFYAHLTHETKICIEQADFVLYLVNDPAMKSLINAINSNSESLDEIYNRSSLRAENYSDIVLRIVSALEKYKTVCFIVYGHPLVLSNSALKVAQYAKDKGINLQINPAISAEDCLFADLMIDPGTVGCQSFEATDFLLYKRNYDSSSHLVIWQPYVIGVLDVVEEHNPVAGLEILKERLLENYRKDHEIILYEAAQYPGFKPTIDRVKLENLPTSGIRRLTTLYIPPALIKSKDEGMRKQLLKISA